NSDYSDHGSTPVFGLTPHRQLVLGLMLRRFTPVCRVGPRARNVGFGSEADMCAGTCRSGTNADNRLPRAALSRVEGGDGIVEGRDAADVRPQSSVTHPLNDLTQLGTIGLDNEVDRQAVGVPRLGRPNYGHQRSSGSDQACGPLLDVAADDIEHQIDSADVFQGGVVEVDELLRAEVERLRTVGSASGADDVA